MYACVIVDIASCNSTINYIIHYTLITITFHFAITSKHSNATIVLHNSNNNNQRCKIQFPAV